VEKVILENKKCQKKLQTLLLQDGLTQLRDASLLHFSKCTASELTNFILVHVLLKHDTASKQMYFRNENISKLPNKLQVANAAMGQDCLILRAFKLRDSTAKLKLPRRPQSVNSISSDRWAGPMEINFGYDCQTTINIETADLLTNTQWLEMTRNIVDPLKIIGDSVVKRTLTQCDFDTGKKLHTLLMERLCVHISRKVDDKHQKHWVWNFFRTNLNVASATLVLTGHVKGFDATHKNVFARGSAISYLEGCYLYWDTVGNRFIRSGKVSGGGERRQWRKDFCN
jgi:hypothetical protein